MVTWALLDDKTALRIWDEYLVRLPDASPFQTYAFGEYNRALGWQPYYFAAFDEKRQIVSMCIGLLRKYPFGVGLMWCVGGPMGDVGSWDDNFREFVRKSTGLNHLYFRFRCDRERTVKDVLTLNHHRWARSGFMMTSSLTMELDISQTPERLLAGMSQRWRRNLRRAQRNDLVFKATTNPDIPTLCRAFEQMEARKKLPPLFSREKLDSLFKQVSNNLVFLQCEDERGNVLCFRAVLVLGQHACGYFAATTDYGLKSDASYQILWESILRCKELGVTRFDLGGIDPAANPGGFNFKKGTGARELESLGEWDWATSTWLRLFGNWAIKRRQKAKSMRTEIALPTKLIPLKWVEGPRSFPARLPHSGAK